MLLTGGSAGGVGTFLNVDWLAKALPQAVVKGAPNAGWWVGRGRVEVEGG